MHLVNLPKGKNGFRCPLDRNWVGFRKDLHILEEKNLLFLPRIELRTLGSVFPSLITIMIELPRLSSSSSSNKENLPPGNCALPDYYAASSGNYLPTFRDADCQQFCSTCTANALPRKLWKGLETSK